MYIICKDNTIKLYILKNPFKRFMGFMFKKNINYALCFPRCNSIHTFFMKENIDVYMTDKNNKILYIYKNLNKNKIILPKKNIYNTYELPVNIIDLKINDYIKIKDNQ